MGLSLPGDLVMDVARAADPARARAAVGRLENAASGKAFAAVMEQTGAPVLMAPRAQARDVQLDRLDRQFAKPEGEPKNVGAAFEAMMLQSLLQNMMPQSASTTFGKGAAGSAYKMLMAEQLAKQITGAGGIGVAALIERSLQAKRDAAVAPRVLGRNFDV